MSGFWHSSHTSCRDPCVSPPVAWRGSVPGTSIRFPGSIAVVATRAVSQNVLLVEGLSLGWGWLARMADSCSHV